MSMYIYNKESGLKQRKNKTRKKTDLASFYLSQLREQHTRKRNKYFVNFSVLSNTLHRYFFICFIKLSLTSFKKKIQKV